MAVFDHTDIAADHNREKNIRARRLADDREHRAYRRMAYYAKADPALRLHEQDNEDAAARIVRGLLSGRGQ